MKTVPKISIEIQKQSKWVAKKKGEHKAYTIFKRHVTTKLYFKYYN